MSCYIIPIGGTGERVMRAVTHLAAAGVFDGAPANVKNINMLGIDPDSVSFAKTILMNTLSEYSKLNIENVFKTKISKSADGIWSPMDQLHTSLAKDVGETTKETELFEFLYSKRERNFDLSGGFYSHTSIGSYYILDGIVGDDGKFVEPWKTFFSNIKQTDKIIIICSMFGGTGASGVPTIARELRRHNIAGEDTSKATITGIFLEPYFASEKAETVNTSAFPTKSKIAFEYYDQQNFGKDIFDNMYFLGESNEMMKVKHHEAGDKQRNKANIIELYAATAVLSEMLDVKAHIPGAGDVLLAYRGTNKTDDIFSRKSLQIKDVNGKTINIFKNLAYFMAFCVIYTKVIYPLIAAHDEALIGYKASFLNKYDLIEKVDGNKIPTKQADLLRSFCDKYMEWMREIITESKGFVDFDPKDLNDHMAADFPYTNWFTRKPYTLYNEHPDYMGAPLDVANIVGFEKMIKGNNNENDLPTSQQVYNALCDMKGKGHTISELVNDVLGLLRTLNK